MKILNILKNIFTLNSVNSIEKFRIKTNNLCIENTVEFKQINILQSHRFCMQNRKDSMHRVPTNMFPIGTSLSHCNAYELFATASKNLDLQRIDHTKIKSLIVTDLKNGLYRFKYFINSEIEFEFDFDWEAKEKIRILARKEEIKRNKPIRILRRR